MSFVKTAAADAPGGTGGGAQGPAGPTGPTGPTGSTGPAGTYVAPTPRTSTVSETIVLTDNNNIIRGNSASALVYTIPADATVAWPDQAIVSLYQMGVGAVSFAAGTGVTLRSPSGIAASVQYGVVAALRIGANEWTLI